MKIEKVSIKKYRTLEDVEINFNGFFSSISGKNNAGKSTVIKAIRNVLTDEPSEYTFLNEDEVDYSDKTKWEKSDSPIEIEYKFTVSKESDIGLFTFVEKIASLKELNEEFNLTLRYSLNEKNDPNINIDIDNTSLEKYDAQEVYNRIKSTRLAFVHNSTDPARTFFLRAGMKSFHEMFLSKEEKEELKKEQEKLKKKIRKFAQNHRIELSGLLGKFQEKYEVELNAYERTFNSAIPLEINLRDKNLEIPLDDWGSGTKNRTQILMSILSASRIKQQNDDENRITPIIIIEEPECFLHPSAQAEFGRVIRNLARELEIQIIITTHSPYMLCQEKPESNVLLDRKIIRGALRGTQVIPVTNERWTEPFSEILGLNDEALTPWKSLVSASKDNVVLVEGDIDKEYLEYISSLGIKGFELPDGIEIIPYGGKDALKNSIMLKFIIEKFRRTFITFDLDAVQDLKKVMEQLGLEEFVDYMAVGLNDDGKTCMEGLLPVNVISEVCGESPDLMMKLQTTDSGKRKSAKNELKRKFLDKFKSKAALNSTDLKAFKPLFANINKAFS